MVKKTIKFGRADQWYDGSFNLNIPINSRVSLYYMVITLCWQLFDHHNNS